MLGYGQGAFGSMPFGGAVANSIVSTDIDTFDEMMISTCAILGKDTTLAVNKYGQPSQVLSTLLTTWPCRLSTRPSGGKEFKAVKQTGKNYFVVFMRLPMFTGSPLTIHHWLEIDGVRYNILNINDPSNMHHHLEVEVEQVIP